ncbi:CHAT domain-containing protein [Snuella sedimenti]|uniref:CHAT domain-containing protein n=1 Tax=Snuella sedimenti TaxID=2798802 RepID=A0A8J7IEM4_9FLAO|nr:CHAT domain-containing protein [Snuella sedimenti]MBJ6366692.1 CHAT domain-containing protein [Snuella sedimenti]
MNKLYVLLFFYSVLGFSQNLEERIYVATETFIANKNETSLKTLSSQEATFKKQVKTKDEQLALVFLQCNKGYYLHELGDLNNAINTYEEASNRFSAYKLGTLSDFDIIESCLKPLGNLYIKTGDFTNATNTIKHYIFVATEKKQTNHQIGGTINLVKLYQSIGEHQIALKITEEALKLSEASLSQKENLQLAKINSLIALKAFDQALIENYSPFITSKFSKHKNSYYIALQKEDYQKALQHFNKAKAFLTTTSLTSREVAKFHVEEAQLHILLNEPNKASKSLKAALSILVPNYKKEGLPTKEVLYAENTFIDIFDLYASIQTNTSTALNSLDLSFFVSRLLRNNWTSQESKIKNQVADRHRSETCIGLLFNAYNNSKDKTFIFRAFQYAEKSKATVLTDNLLKKKRLQKHPNDSLLIKEFALLKEQEHLTSLLIKEQLGTSQASKISALSQKLRSLSFQLKTLKTQISEKYPENNGSISISDLQQKLKADKATLVYYFFGGNSIYQFIISHTDNALFKIPLNNTIKKDLTDFIHLFDNAAIINNDIKRYTLLAHQAYNLLNFNAVKTEKNVIVIPDGLLNFVPFEALLTKHVNTTVFSKMPYVVKQQTIVYNTNALFYFNERVKAKNNKLLGYFPVFENSTKELSYSINEAKTIQSEMPSKLFLKKAATKSSFIENVQNYGTIHLSTHASGGDFVTPASIDFYDDSLYLHELYSRDINSNLVVLSACETGIGTLYKGEGPMNMARGFQYAGAQNLLISLWQINDLSTSQIMQSFYKHYNNNQLAFRANRISKIDYLGNKSISNVKKSPYYWSAFVFYGSFGKPVDSGLSLLFFYMGISIVIILIAVLLMPKLKTND